LIAALYNGRLALLCTAMAMVCADYFLQEPLYTFANDNPLEYGEPCLVRSFSCDRDQIYPGIGTAPREWLGGCASPADR